MATVGKMSERNAGLLNRSGETRSRSPSSASIAEVISSQIAVLAVDSEGSDAGALGHPDLVAHQREERRDEDRRSGPGVPEQPRRDEVHGRLPPPRALDEEDPTALNHDGVDGFELAWTEGGVRPSDGMQELEGAVTHTETLPVASDVSPEMGLGLREGEECRSTREASRWMSA